MLLDKDNKILQDTYENAFLTFELLEEEGFKCVGCTNVYKYYKYQKSGLGLVQLRIFNLRDVSDKVDFDIFPEDRIVAVVDVTNPLTEHNGVQECSYRYLLTVKDLKNYLKFRKILTKISLLEHQAADMLSENVFSDNKDYQRRTKGEKV